MNFGIIVRFHFVHFTHCVQVIAIPRTDTARTAHALCHGIFGDALLGEFHEVTANIILGLDGKSAVNDVGNAGNGP